ncbi:MAG: hypothetical protein JWL84_272 [Rhodospirillales bacterium]|jgi:hypothetical protein|nr:hypothetical protein [Rhodospirillales bacterium]
MKYDEVGLAADRMIQKHGAAACAVAERAAAIASRDGVPHDARIWRRIAAAIKRRQTKQHVPSGEVPETSKSSPRREASPGSNGRG